MSAGEKFLERQAAAVLLKPATVARQLEIGLRTLWRWVSCGQFPPPDLRRGPKIVRWKASTVAEWVEANANEAATITKGGRR